MGNPILGRLKMNRKSNLIISLSVCIFRMIPAGQVGAVISNAVNKSRLSVTVIPAKAGIQNLYCLT